MRLLARNPEPKSVVYDPIPYASEQGSYFWSSRELNRVIRELIRLISEPRDLAVISIQPKPSIRTTRSRRAGCPEEAELHLSGGDPAAIVAFCRERLVSYKVPARLAFRTAAQLPRSPGAAPRRSGKSRRASGSVAALPRSSTAAATISGMPTTKACTMSGCCSRTCSTSSGATLTPPILDHLLQPAAKSDPPVLLGRGTDGSNPSTSSGEPRANPTSSRTED